MKCKIFLLIICLMLLSACNATYNIEINKNKESNESIVIKNIDDYYSKQDIDSAINKSFPDSSNINYNIEGNNLIINRKLSKYYNLNHNYTIDKEFGDISILENKISLKPNYDKCIFLFSDGGEYISDDKIEINLTIPFKISKNNADKINGNTYTWIYSINDCNKEAYIEFKESNVFAYILILIGIIIIGVCIFIKKRKNRSDI